MFSYKRYKTVLSGKGFTLIELVVIVSTISLLMTLLMPALKRSLDIGKGITCVNNLKQVSFAQESHAADYGYYAPGRIGSYEDYNQHWWHHKIRIYLGSDTVPTSWGQAHDLARIDPLWCPETETTGTGTDTFSYAPNGFGYMKAYFGLTPCIPATSDTNRWAPHYIKPITAAPTIPPSHIMLMSELGYTIGSLNGYVSHTIINGHYYNGKAISQTLPAFRHSGKKNALFLDGHIQEVLPDEIEFSNVLR